MSNENNTNENNVIPSFLPLFDGFYATHFDSDFVMDWDSEIEYYESEDYENGIYADSELTSEDFDWDNEGYQNAIAERFTTVIGKLLKDKHFITDIESAVVVSPKYYNFSNDSINCDFVLSELNSDNINGFIHNHSEAFTEYLKERYTSCDGFISSHSNEFADWQYHTNNFTFKDVDFQIEDFSHALGSVLQFIATQLLLEDYESEDIAYHLYEQTTEDFCACEYLSFNEELYNSNRED